MLEYLPEISVKYFRCDNSGENKKFQELIKSKTKINVTFEFTAPNTPQQNGKVERKFATLYGKVRSILNSAKLNDWLKGQFWAYAAQHATRMENIIVDSNGKSSYEKLWNKAPKWIKYLKSFGDVAIVHDSTKIKSKLMDRGFPCIFIGHTEDHAPNVYLFYNIQTKATLLTRNVIWLNKTYRDHK